jgi:fumarate hydratase class II
MTLGQEFMGFAHTLAEDHDRLSETIPWLNEINMGATAIGTGITADPRYAEAVRRHLVDVTGIQMETAPDLIEATSDAGIFMTLSGTLKRAAVKLSKICNDLRLLSSGPQAGIGEINLPPRQAGSSIMPGKVNPVIPEAVLMVCSRVIGNDASIAWSGASGAFELNVAIPVMGTALLESIRLLSNSSVLLADKTVAGLEANLDRARALAESSPSIVTPLNRIIGYEAAAKIAKHSVANKMTVREAVIDLGFVERGEVTLEQLDKALDVLSMTAPPAA